MAAKKNEIIIGNFEEGLKHVNKELGEVLIFLDKLGIMGRQKISGSFENEKEIAVFFEKIVSNFLLQKHKEFYDRVSHLRKNGAGLFLEISMKLQAFKLKLKVFRVNQNKKSFDKAFLILEAIEKNLNEIELSQKNSQLIKK